MTDMTLREILEEKVNTAELMGHPSLIERFVLRNGKEFTPTKRIGRKGRPKECFGNATNFVIGKGGTYVEGFTNIPDVGGWPVHHAWVTMTGKDAMDPTLKAEGREYIGVEFDKTVLRAEMIRNKVYGLLDTGFYNIELMFKLDPELEEICERIKKEGGKKWKAMCAELEKKGKTPCTDDL